MRTCYRCRGVHEHPESDSACVAHWSSKNEMTSTPDSEKVEPKSMREMYLAAMAKLPPFHSGRLAMNTWLPEPVRVGRVESDIVRYIYFEDSQEVIVLGQRADEIAFAASEYVPLKTRIAELETDLKALEHELSTDISVLQQRIRSHGERDSRKRQERIDARATAIYSAWCSMPAVERPKMYFTGPDAPPARFLNWDDAYREATEGEAARLKHSEELEKTKNELLARLARGEPTSQRYSDTR
jgi:hypothetical protein